MISNNRLLWRWLLGLSCLAFSLFGQIARADDGAFRVLSTGNKTCGSFVKGDVQTKELDLAWAIGFVSGANWRSSGAQRRVGELWEHNACLVWLENYCSKSPLDTFFQATVGLRNALAKNEGISPTE